MRFNPFRSSLSLPCCAVAGMLFLLGSTPGQAQQRDTEKPSKKPTVRSSSSSAQRSTPSQGSSSRNRDMQRMQNRSKPGGERRATTSTSGSTSSDRRRHSTSRSSADRGRRDHGYRHRDRSGSRHYRRGHSYYRHGYYGHHGYPYYRSHYYYYPRASFYWYGSYYPFYYGYRHAYDDGAYRSYGQSGPVGALDLDVKPEKAEVYVNGRYAGVADNFDGFPAYLWLEEGNYEIAFYKEGYETITRDFTVTPEAVIDVRDEMRSGQAVRPEAPPEAETTQASNDELGGREEEWRQRAREYRQRRAPAEQAPVQPPSGGAFDARQEPGKLLLSIEPKDASIYLDGRFLGTADDLARLHSGLILDPGEHELQILRPGFTAESKTFDVGPGEEVNLTVRLESNGGEA